MAVAVQNQTGRYPTKWDKTVVIIEIKKHSHVLVKMDGSWKVSFCNRRFVKQILPPVRHCAPTHAEFAIASTSSGETKKGGQA